MVNYLIAKIVSPKGACKLMSIQNVRQDYRLAQGDSYIADFPEDALFKMDETFPKDVRLVDALSNTSSLLVVSERFKKVLEDTPGALTANEVLPVKIINHKGRTEPSPYYVIHQLDHPACLDEKSSKGRRFSLDPKEFQFLKKMVLDPAAIPEDRQLFRAAQFTELPLVRRDLADVLTREKLTGIELREIAGYEF